MRQRGKIGMVQGVSQWCRKGRKFGAIALILSITFLLGACHPLSLNTTASHRSQVVQSILSDPKTFNAVLSQESPNIFGLTYEGLIRENLITGIKEPALAESWQISEDQLKITFTLRPNLKWSDGEPLTIEDVLFSYQQLYLNEAIPSNARDSLRIGQSGALPSVRKVDSRRIEFTIPEPFAPFLDGAGLPILPRHILQKTVEASDREGNPMFLSTWGVDTPPQEIVVNGPYQLESYDTSQRVIFRRNPYYWQRDEQGNALPYIKRIIWEIVESQDTSLLQFRSGSLDAIGITPEYFSLLKKEENRGNFAIYNGGPAYGTQFVCFNLNQGRRNGQPLVDPVKSRWFNNVNFRRAIAHSIDRQRMINNIYRGLGQPQNSPISVQSPFYHQTLKGYDYNPQRALSLLRQEGFQRNQAGELLDQEGNRVRFTLMTNAGNQVREALSSQIQQDLKKIGIKVDLTPIAFNVLVEKLSDSLEWDAILLGFTGGNEPHGGANVWFPDGNLHMINQKPQPGREPIQGRVIADWEQKIGELYIQGARELDIAKRKAIYAQTQQLTADYLPYIYLVNPLALSGVRNRIQGVQFSALGGAFWNIERLKIEEEVTQLSES